MQSRNIAMFKVSGISYQIFYAITGPTLNPNLSFVFSPEFPTSEATVLKREWEHVPDDPGISTIRHNDRTSIR